MCRGERVGICQLCYPLKIFFILLHTTPIYIYPHPPPKLCRLASNLHFRCGRLKFPIFGLKYSLAFLLLFISANFFLGAGAPNRALRASTVRLSATHGGLLSLCCGDRAW